MAEKGLKLLIKCFNNITPAVKRLTAATKRFSFALKATAYPDKRIVRLALYGKHRTRKKNTHRVERWLEKHKAYDWVGIDEMHELKSNEFFMFGIDLAKTEKESK